MRKIIHYINVALIVLSVIAGALFFAGLGSMMLFLAWHQYPGESIWESLAMLLMSGMMYFVAGKFIYEIWDTRHLMRYEKDE